MSDEFFSFDEALDELRLKEEELKRLVSEGEIRAFRKGDTMKLRRSDVEALRNELSTGGEVVDLGDATEELVFEDDADDETGMATQEIADVETIIEEDIEDIDLDDEPVAATPVRRTSAIAAAAAEDETESMGVRFALILGSLIMVISFPVLLGVSTGNVDDLAKSIAGIFGNEFPDKAPAAVNPDDGKE
ncbi:MAG: helix-turn-helix domain-containing protein [Planctomycetota bacterium]|nr:helix-turn-helix domain-containing protein [Planctomycetota bacterium]